MCSSTAVAAQGAGNPHPDRSLGVARENDQAAYREYRTLRPESRDRWHLVSPQKRLSSDRFAHRIGTGRNTSRGIKLTLSEVSNPAPNDGFASATQEYHQKRGFAQTLLKERALSEPSESIGGVPLPMDFDADITVTLDSLELPPMKGQLLLRRAEGVPEPTIYLLLVTEGAVVPGWSWWNTAIDGDMQPAETRTPGAQAASRAGPISPNIPMSLTRVITEQSAKVTAENGRIHVVISPSGTLRHMVWKATNDPGHPE